MNINQQIIEFITANPLSAASEVAKGVGVSLGLTRSILTELHDANQIDRINTSSCWQYLIQSGESSKPSAEYNRHRQLAQELEKKQLYRRAARAWLSAFDACRDEGLREKAARHRENCIHMSALPRPDSYAGGAIRDASASSLPALAIWRD